MLHYHLDRVTRTLSLVRLRVDAVDINVAHTARVPLENLGDIIGIFIAIPSAIIDVMLGIRSVWLTNPIFMLANTFAVFNCQHVAKVHSYDRR